MRMHVGKPKILPDTHVHAEKNADDEKGHRGVDKAIGNQNILLKTKAEQ
jgi:hypothetical protein